MEKNKILVSVIVAAYNIEQYLPRCLDSLLAQTCKSLEIILVDDGSTDLTPEICDSYAKIHQNIVVIHKDNGGLSSARNAGLKAVRGAYIGYVDGDDWVEPEMYEAMLGACLEKKAEIAVCAYRQIGKDEEEIHYTGNILELDRNETLELYISGHEQYHIYHSVWSKLFKRELVKDIRFYEGRSSEDIMYSTMALAKSSRCVFLDTPYYNYVTDRPGSIMNSRLHERRFRDEIPFWKEQIGYLKSQGFEELSGKAAYQFYRRMLYYYIDFRDNKMKASACGLAELLRNDRKLIRRIYGKEYVAAGDKARMILFLFCPGLYYRIVKMYDNVIIPLRQ